MEKTRQNPLISAFGSFFGHVNLNGRLSAAVESDVVGYTTITTAPGFNMVGCVFNGLDGNPKDISDLIRGDFQQGDEVQVYNNPNINPSVDGSVPYRLYKYNAEEKVWKLGRRPSSESPIYPGESFWLKTPDRAVDVTTIGAVKTLNPSYTGREGIQMVSLPAPVRFSLNDAKWENLTDGDQVQRRKADGSYYLYKYNAETQTWKRGRYPLTDDDDIKVGEAFWLNVSNPNVKLTVPTSVAP